MKFNNNHTQVTNAVKEDFTGQASATVPGEAFTVSELYARSIRGQDISLMRRFGIYEDNPSYDDDMVILRSPNLDLTDITAITERFARTLEIIKEKRASGDPIEPIVGSIEKEPVEEPSEPTV